MVSRCVNPACCAELKVFNTGNLYALERRSANTEFFWLCPDCVPVVDLYLDCEERVSVRPRTNKERREPPHREHRLRLVSRVVGGIPWERASRTRGLILPSKYRRDSFSPPFEAA
jgi:hypothetical protein